MRRLPRWISAVLGLWSVITTIGGAQTVTAITGAVNGVVTDSTEAALPGVTVTLSGPTLMSPRTGITDEQGRYRFPAVPIGDHTLTFELAGFGFLVRTGVHVGVGFIATIDAELSPGGITDHVTVTGSPVVDLSATTATTHFASAKLANLPGARDVFSVLSNTPGVAFSKMDVGGNTGLSLQEYTAFGLRATTGINRNEVEGVRVGGANGANDNYLSDFASFAEIAITAVGQSAAMSVPGTLAQYVSKSGGDAFRGSVYADFQSDALEASNIDDEQLAAGVTGGAGLAARDVNRLQQFRDFTADAGGYVRRQKAWWYAAYRSTFVEQPYPWLLDAAVELSATVGTGKGTYLLSPRHKFVGYLQHERFRQSSFFVAGTNQALQTEDALQSLVFPVTVWKGEYNATLTEALYVEARVGGYHSVATARSKSAAARIADVGANTISGGALRQERRIDRPQLNGVVSFVKGGWGGHHTFKFGGEYMNDLVVTPTIGYGGACNCVSTLNNGVPSQVQLLLGPNVSKNALATAAGFIDDTWRLHRRITVTAGMRLDRYQPILPAQQGPEGQLFAAIDPVLTFNNWGPRAGLNADLTGDGKTVVKLHYGKFWVYPAPLFTAAFNPNPVGWSQTYLWPGDPNANRRWDPGEEGRLIAVSGGTASARLDPDIGNTYVRQTSAYLEREVAPEFALRAGVVRNAARQPYGTINVSRPLGAYSVPVAVVDPGPDGLSGSSDDGPSITAYDLDAASLGIPSVNLTTNLPENRSEYYTFEVTATRRERGRWSLLASFTQTWSREATLGTGNDFTPNGLINVTRGQDRFTTRQARVNATATLPWSIRVVPVFRYQSGQPFARTFVSMRNYGNATIKTEPVGARRTPDIALVDLRTEKTFRVSTARVSVFFDVYNILNTNAPQTVTTSSGPSFLRPTAITGPRVARVGGRFEW